MRARSAICFGALLMVSVAVWCLRVNAGPQVPRDPLEPGRFYEVNTSTGQARFDLAFSNGSRYLLIVSSLGDAAETYCVRLETEEGTPGAVAQVPELKLVPALPTRLIPARREAAAPVAAASTSPNSQPSGSPAERSVVESSAESPARMFFVHVADTGLEDVRGYTRVRAQVVGTGRHVRIYLDTQLPASQLAPGLIEELLQRMDEEVIPVTLAKFGAHRDVDRDGKLAILLTPWLGKLQGGQTSLNGFVRSGDFMHGLQAPYSNQADVLYLNSNLRPGAHLKALLAHEYLHAVAFSLRLPASGDVGGLRDEEDWLSEALAHLAENAHDAGWSNLDYRISRYLEAPERYPLAVPDYFGAGLWRDHGCRGATYLFLRWCADQYGEEMLYNLLRNPAVGTRNLETETGIPFSVLYRHWTMALVQSGSTAHTNRDQISTEHGAQNAAGAATRYSSLDLRRPLGKWGLAGPHCEQWNIDTSPRDLSIRGTATAFIEVRATARSGTRRVKLSAPAAALQVTLVPRD